MKIIRNPRASGGGAVDATTLAATINAATSKTTPVDADQFPITDSAASGALRRFTFANLWAWIRGLADTRYAVQTVTTGPFTAIVGRRFITENAGTLQINDPTTRSDGSALVAGDSYEVIVGSGTINFNGLLPNYAPSRFMVRRRWTGSAWVTPTPVLSDTLQVGTGSWSGSSFSGAQSFSNQVELVGQTATNGTSAINRDLGDTRYGNIIVSRLSANSAPIQSQTLLQNTGCSVALPVGVWLIQAQTNVENADATAQFKFGCSVSGGTSSTDRGRVSWGFGNTGTTNFDNAAFLTGQRALGNGTRAFISYDGIIAVTAGTTTVATQYAQNVSVAANTFVSANSYIVARRIG